MKIDKYDGWVFKYIALFFGCMIVHLSGSAFGIVGPWSWWEYLFAPLLGAWLWWVIERLSNRITYDALKGKR